MTRGSGLLVLGCAVLLAACDGDGRSSSAKPGIAPAAARELASSSEELAQLLDSGDVCAAAGKADELQRDAAAAISSGRVRRKISEPLSEATTQLVNEVNCPPPPPPVIVEPKKEKPAPKPHDSKAPKPAKSQGEGD
jgi:hypothetical protein